MHQIRPECCTQNIAELPEIRSYSSLQESFESGHIKQVLHIATLCHRLMLIRNRLGHLQTRIQAAAAQCQSTPAGIAGFATKNAKAAKGAKGKAVAAKPAAKESDTDERKDPRLNLLLKV